MSTPATNREKATLAVLAAANGEPLTPVQLQKALFLVCENAATLRDVYHFIPYDYGPFSATVYEDVKRLASAGAVIIERGARSGFSTYRSTVKGYATGVAHLNEMPAVEAEYVRRLVEWVRSVSFRDLLRAIYQAYPKMATRSVFRG